EQNQASEKIKKAEDLIKEVEDLGLETSDLVQLLNQAKSEFANKEYKSVLEKANQTINSAENAIKTSKEKQKLEKEQDEQLEDQYREALELINKTESLIKEAENIGLDSKASEDLEELLTKAKTAFNEKYYISAINYAKHCINNTENAIKEFYEKQKLEKERKEQLEEQRKLASELIKKSENLLQSAKSMGLDTSDIEDLLEKARDAINKKYCINAIYYAESSKRYAENIISEHKEKIEMHRKQSLEIINESEKTLKEAEDLGLDISEFQSLFNQAKDAYDAEDYTKSLEFATQCKSKIDEAIKQEPKLSIKFPSETFKLNTWKRLNVSISNNGGIDSKDIQIEFSGDLETRAIQPIPSLRANETLTIKVGIKPIAEGEVPIDVHFKYKDILGREYSTTEEVWINTTNVITVVIKLDDSMKKS
ncbi:MAG: CARDB domain-containing protein, partial [Methanosarcinales archaeon]